jgi:hypothetical protein
MAFPEIPESSTKVTRLHLKRKSLNHHDFSPHDFSQEINSWSQNAEKEVKMVTL